MQFIHESQLLGYFVWVYFALGGSVSVHKWHILGRKKKNQGETVVLPAAHCCCRVKSQCSNLKRHVLARSTAGQGCFYLLIFLQAPKMFSWNMLMAGGRGGVLFITSHNLHSHTDRIQGLLSTGKLTAHVSPEECEGGVWISWHLQPASNLENGRQSTEGRRTRIGNLVGIRPPKKIQMDGPLPLILYLH